MSHVLHATGPNEQFSQVYPRGHLY